MRAACQYHMGITTFQSMQRLCMPRIWRSVEAASSHAAREAARADAKARAAKKKDPAQAQLLELERLKASLPRPCALSISLSSDACSHTSCQLCMREWQAAVIRPDQWSASHVLATAQAGNGRMMQFTGDAPCNVPGDCARGL